MSNCKRSLCLFIVVCAAISQIAWSLPAPQTQHPTTRTYRLGYYDRASHHQSEYCDNATDVPIATGATISGIDASLDDNYGWIQGTVSGPDGVAPLVGATVSVYDATTNSCTPVGSGNTDASGHYSIGDLPAGTYHVGFSAANHLDEYYQDAAGLRNAADVVLATGATVTGINASLAPLPTITPTFFENFDDGVADGFEEIQSWDCQGPWCSAYSVENGEYHIYGANDMASSPGAVVGAHDWCNYVVDVDVRLEAVDGTSAWVSAGYPGCQGVGFYWVERDGWWQFTGPNIYFRAVRAFTYGQTYHLKLDLTGGQARVYLDDELLQEADLSANICGKATIGIGEANGYFDNFRVSGGITSAAFAAGPTTPTTMTLPSGWGIINLPAGVVTGTTAFTYTQISTPTQATGVFASADRSFTLVATDAAGQPITTFAGHYTLTLNYLDSDWQSAGIPAEENLNLYYWNGTAWVAVLPCAGCSLDTVNNRLTAVLDHLTEFALLGNPLAAPAVSATKEPGGVELRWTQTQAGIVRYEVYRGTSPYFTGGTKLTPDVDPPGPGAQATFTDATAFDPPLTNYYYLVLAIGAGEAQSPASNRVGAFHFTLTPGAQ